MVQVRGKEWEAGAKEATDESVAANGTIGDGSVHVDKIVERLNENHKHPHYETAELVFKS